MAENLPAVFDKNALIQSIQGKLAPEAASYLISVLKNDIRALATDEVFALRDGSGEIRAFKQSLTLSSYNGGLVQPVAGGPYVLSAQGYEMWAEAAGAQVVFPTQVLVGTEMLPNPAVVRDPVNGRILYVAARAVAYRFTSKGIPQVSDWTTYYDNPSYRMIDLLSKAKKEKTAFRLLPAGEKPEVTNHEKWAGYPFDEALTLWIDVSHESVIGWLGTIVNREKKSIDFAQTFAKRNALKHLSGIQKVPGQEFPETKSFKKDGEEITYVKMKVTPIPEWTVPIISWRSTGKNIINWSSAEYEKLQSRVSRLIENASEFASEDVIDIPYSEITTGREDVGEDVSITGDAIDPEDVMEEAVESKPFVPGAEDVPTTSTRPTPVAPPVAKSVMTPAEEKLFANFNVTRADFPSEFKKACMFFKVGFGDDVEYTPDQMSAIMKKINEFVDQF